MSNNHTFCDSNHVFSNDDDDGRNIDNEPLEVQVNYFKKRLEDLQIEFDEFSTGSRELETEMETQLKAYEIRNRDLDHKNQQLKNDNEYLRSKLDKLSTESRTTIADLQKKLREVTDLNEQLASHIRDLEQSNDDLERAKRHLDTTLQDFDSKLNEQIERNELLESEIGEKEELHAVIQRLKDEARDLRHELLIQQNAPTSSPTSTTTTTTNSRKLKLSESLSADYAKGQNGSLSNGNAPTTTSPTSSSSSAVTGISAQHDSEINLPTVKASPVTTIPLLSASSRISALNIVSDLLRKVGALESKLASCRTIVPVSSAMIAKNNGNAIKAVTAGSAPGGNENAGDVGV